MANYITEVKDDGEGLHFLCRLEGLSSSGLDFSQEIDAARNQCRIVSPNEILVSPEYDGDFPSYEDVSAYSAYLDREREWLECIRSFLLKQGYKAKDFDFSTPPESFA
jgi:hypothetical protein